MRKKEDILIETLRNENKLPASYLKLEKADDGQKLLEARHELLKPYFAWENIRHDLESYLLVLGCHYWAPTFELTLENDGTYSSRRREAQHCHEQDWYKVFRHPVLGAGW